MKKMNLRLLALNTALAFLLIGSAGPGAMTAYADTYSQNSSAMQDYLNFLSGQSSGQTQGTTTDSQSSGSGSGSGSEEISIGIEESTGTQNTQNISSSFEEWSAQNQSNSSYNQSSSSYSQSSSSYNQSSSFSEFGTPGQGGSAGSQPDVYVDPNAVISGNPLNDTAGGSSAQNSGMNQGAAASSAAASTAQNTAGTSQNKRPFEPPVQGRTPDKSAITGGTWNQEQSGEWTYYLRDGSKAKDVWVSYQGMYYYIDCSGCMMRSNYSSDGFWVLGDGSWDRTSPQRTTDQIVAALSGRRYGTNPYWTFDYTGTGNGNYDFKAVKTYSFGYAETLTCRPVGYGVYILLTNDGTVVGQMGVSDDRGWVFITECGYTENYQLQN